jgi:type VI secretion system secreted protein VgrG
MGVRTLPSQAGRVLRIDTPAKPDAFLLVGLAGEEAVNSLFRYTLDLVSDKPDISPDTLIGSSVGFGVIEGLAPKPGQEPRWFNGIVAKFGGGLNAGEDLFSYRMEVVPKLWLAGLKKRSRVRENITPKDMLNLVLGEYGIRPEFKGSFDQTSHKIITQYQETDLSLVMRLVELGGGCWYFTHTKTSHALVIGAGTAAFGTVDGDDPNLSLDDFSAQSGTVPKKITVHDWDFKKKSAVVGSAEAKGGPAGGPDLSFSEYMVGQGSEETSIPPDKVAARRLESAMWEANLIRASSDTPRLSPGLKFPATGQTPKINGQTYSGFTVVSVRHAASDMSFIVGGGQSSYRNEVVLAPETLPLTAPPRGARPRIYGMHTATVTEGWDEGATGDPDKLARVRIKYHWGPDGGTDPQSIWARVAQQWVGRSWGSIWTPPIGTEVLVAFLDGDPDRPIVVGCLYNGIDKIHAKIGNDHAKTRNGVVTKSGHEFWFDDKSGSEKIRMYSKKDLDIEVQNNRKTVIHANDTQSIYGKRTQTVTGDTALTVTKGNVETVVEKGNVALKATLGNISTKADAGAIAEEAMQKIEMKVGTNSITIDQTGVTIKGLMVKIEATAMLDAKAPMTTVKGDGMLILKGGIVLIN